MNFSSILTNTQAMSAVSSLNATEQSLAQVQNQISTGLSVSSAEDNAAYYSIAQTMRTNVSNLSAVTSSLNLGSSVVSTATTATSSMTSILQTLSADLTTALSNVGSSEQQTYLQTSINALNSQLASIANTASFNGTNLLDGSSGSSVSFVSGVTGSGSNTTITTLSVNTSLTNLNGAAYTGSDNKITNALSAAAALGAAETTNTTAQAALTTATSNNSSAVSNLTTAVAALTYADLGGGSGVSSGTGDSAFQAAFGIDATMTSAGVVTGIDASSLAGKLLGAGASGATVTLGSLPTTSGGTGSTLSSYTSDNIAGGTLGALYGASSTKTTSTGTSTSAAGVASTASAAVTSATTANTTATAALNSSELATYKQVSGGALFSLSQISLTGSTSAAQIQSYINQVATATTAVTTASEVLGAAASNIDLQSTYISSLSDSITTGIGSLVDADMNEASTRLSALQTQQQLGVQALSVANQNSQMILKLFQG